MPFGGFPEGAMVMIKRKQGGGLLPGFRFLFFCHVPDALTRVRLQSINITCAGVVTG